MFLKKDGRNLDSKRKTRFFGVLENAGTENAGTGKCRKMPVLENAGTENAGTGK